MREIRVIEGWHVPFKERKGRASMADMLMRRSYGSLSAVNANIATFDRDFDSVR